MNFRITRTITLIAAIVTIGQVLAAQPVKVRSNGGKASMERALDKALNRHLSYPLLAKEDMTGEVFLSFLIDKEGKVEVLECNSANEHLKEYVLRKLARIDIGDNPDGIWRTTHMRVTFKPEQT